VPSRAPSRSPLPPRRLGLALVDRGQYEQTVAAVRELQAVRAAQVKADDERLIDDAIKAGKLTPANKSNWLALMDKDRVGIRATLAQLPAGLIPVAEMGHGVGSEEDHLDAEMAGALRQGHRPQRHWKGRLTMAVRTEQVPRRSAHPHRGRDDHRRVSWSTSRRPTPCRPPRRRRVAWVGVAAFTCASGDKVTVYTEGVHTLAASGAIAAGANVIAAAAGAVATQGARRRNGANRSSASRSPRRPVEPCHHALR
jgi:hypothetical protein